MYLNLVLELDLQKFKLQHQTSLRILCCLKCHILLISQTDWTHVYSYLVISYQKLLKKRYKEVCIQLQIKKEYLILDNLYGIHVLSRLKLYIMVLVCGYKECTVIIASNELIRKHYQKSHGLEDKQLSF